MRCLSQIGGGNRPSTLQGSGIVEVRPLADQVAGAPVYGRPDRPIEAFPSGLAPNGAGDASGLAIQDCSGSVSDPAFGVGVALV